MSASRNTARWRRIWLAPVAIGLTVAVGLGAALFLEGSAARAIVCAALAVPVLTTLRFAFRP